MSLLPIMIWLNIPFSPSQSPYRVRDGSVCRGLVHKEKKSLGFRRRGLAPRPAGPASCRVRMGATSDAHQVNEARRNRAASRRSHSLENAGFVCHSEGEIIGGVS